MANMPRKEREMDAKDPATPYGKLIGDNSFEFVGGYLWLDFVNTELVEKERVVDLLRDVGDLLYWLQESGAIGSEDLRAALERLGGTAEGECLLERGKEFRKILRGACKRFVEEESVAPRLVEEINDLLARRLGYYELAHTPEGFEIRFHPFSARSDGSEVLLTPIAESVARFLAEADPSLVKDCGNPDCILFFYDTSKNHSRRWCSMTTCGNRMKARMHYERTQGKRGV